jgi:hypothetical protein
MVQFRKLLGWTLVAAFLTLATVLLPVATADAQAARPYSGQITQTYTNCGLTQVFGVVVDAAGNPLPGIRVRLWWPGNEVRTVAGNYVRPETNAAGWDFTLNNVAVANTWYVAVEDAGGNLLSEPVAVTTSATCNPGEVNVARVEFRNVPAAPAPPPVPPAPTPAPTDPVPGVPAGMEPAPPIAAGSTCRIYTQTGGFFVCDDANARFLTAFNLYGLQNVGYPVSTRFRWNGLVTQAFQKAILQWRPDGNYVAFINVFDELSGRGVDQTLYQMRQTPYPLPAGWDEGLTWAQVVQRRQALLNERPALRSAYFGVSDPITFFGLPTSEVTDMGNHYSIRLQRAVLQEWKEDVPWARAGQVTVANGGDIAKELDQLPAFALLPDTTPR